MNAWRKAVTCTLTLCTVITAGAAAQSKPQEGKCDIPLSDPSSVKNAFSAITIAQMGKNPEDARKRLQGAVKDLTKEEDHSRNPVGYNYTLGQALVLWSLQPGVSATMSRATVGYQTNPQGTVNLLAAADSALTVVESTSPDCTGQTEGIRMQAWAPLINQVGGLINDNKIDSAKAVLTRANAIYRGSPYNYYFVGNLAQRDSDFVAAADAYRKVLTLATPEAVAKDSNVAAIREYAAFSVGYATLTHAAALPANQQAAEMTKAADAYRAYIKEYPQGSDVAAARAGLTTALQHSGNSDALKGMWAEMTANPGNYSAGQLYDAGAEAFRADDFQDAAKLMEAGHQVNPYVIAGLFNMANVYWKMNDFDKMADVSRQLLGLHPNDPDNWQLLAIAEQGMAKATKDPKLKKARNDSVVKVLTKGNSLPVTIKFSRASAADSSYQVAGQAENLLAKAGTYTIKFEFLDKGGNVVTSKETTVSLAPKATQDFTVQAAQPGIVAFRYAPIT